MVNTSVSSAPAVVMSPPSWWTGENQNDAGYGKLVEHSPVSTLGSKSTSASPVALTIDTDSPPSPPPSTADFPSSIPPSSDSGASSVSLGQIERQSSCGTPTALPPPPSYSAPLVSTPGLPPAPMLPPGMPEPPRAPPRLPANLNLAAPPTTSPSASTPPRPQPQPTSAASSPAHAVLSTTAAPWPMGPTQLKAAAPPADLCPVASPAPPPCLTTTPVSTPTASGITPSVMLPSGSGLLPLPQQPPPDLIAYGPPALPYGLGPQAGLSSANTTPKDAGSVLAGFPGITSDFLAGMPAEDEEVALLTGLQQLLQTGPTVPPLPPSACYGCLHISSAISESLGDAAGAVEEAARNLGDKPVKVLLPWYPTRGATVPVFDHTKPAKVIVS